MSELITLMVLISINAIGKYEFKWINPVGTQCRMNSSVELGEAVQWLCFLLVSQLQVAKSSRVR
jgi:hypothetical protein